MNSAVSKILLSFVLLAGGGFASASGQQRQEEPLTNAAVIKLVRAGFKEKTVIAIIHSRPNNFKLDPERLIDLKRNGVSENIILTMLSQSGGQIVDEDGWGDESFFRNGGVSRTDKGEQKGTDIFGSGGESRDQSSSRGARDANEGNTRTTGSATVRILRPPAEAGGGQALKLEKTPTLNNESIVRLVEAGFSEGTIIKRIEDSPADFDISPAKLEELRKKRVTEPIISAMTAAMDDSGPKTSSPGGGEN
jgi:hypothetical protein